MLEFISNMPEGTVGLIAKGAVTPADCERALRPLVAGRSAPDQRAGMLLQFGPEFDDFGADHLNGNASLDGDARLAFHRWCDFGRLAIVTDVTWLRKAARLLAPFMGGEVRIFHDYEIEQAKTWLASKPGVQRLAHRPRGGMR